MNNSRLDVGLQFLLQGLQIIFLLILYENKYTALPHVHKYNAS